MKLLLGRLNFSSGEFDLHPEYFPNPNSIANSYVNQLRPDGYGQINQKLAETTKRLVPYLQRPYTASAPRKTPPWVFQGQLAKS
jgi:hypothetical protein